MDGADVEGGAEGVEGFLGFGVSRGGVGGKGDVFFSGGTEVLVFLLLLCMMGMKEEI